MNSVKAPELTFTFIELPGTGQQQVAAKFVDGNLVLQMRLLCLCKMDFEKVYLFIGAK